MEVSRIVARSLPQRSPSHFIRNTTSLRNGAILSPATLACSPMAIWSRRQISSSSNFGLPGPPGLGFGGSSGSSSPTYFQRQTSLPANTIIRFVPQQTAWIVERMGKFNRILEPGLAILMPVIDVRASLHDKRRGLTKFRHSALHTSNP